MEELITIREMRRRAPLHFIAKAENARFAAYLLSHIPVATISSAKAGSKYGGDTNIACGEAFRREAALALELILKALVAQKIEIHTAPQDVTQVPVTHDLERLWKDAALPPPSDENLRILLFARGILQWAGRYPAPTEKGEQSADCTQQRIDEVTRRISQTSGPWIPLWGMPWDDFDSIYTELRTKFWTERGENYP
jgi:hypothetical protein